MTQCNSQRLSRYYAIVGVLRTDFRKGGDQIKNKKKKSNFLEEGEFVTARIGPCKVFTVIKKKPGTSQCATEQGRCGKKKMKGF